MKKGLSLMVLVALAGLVTVGGAYAVSPVAGTLYTGTGKDYMNNASKWADEGRGKISFKTSASGAAVTSFRGAYSYYCGAGTATVTEKHVAVTSNGTFATHFSVRTKGPSGKVNGRAYVSISGAFVAGGKANVSYLVDYVFNGTHVKHPYSTKHPRQLGCASWVRGTVKAR
jgi:hypothetical protein